MSSPVNAPTSAVNDILEAVGFAQRRFAEWQERGRLTGSQLVPIRERYETLSRKAREADLAGNNPTLHSLPRAMSGESPTARSLRYWIFLQNEIERFAAKRVLKLAQSHDLVAEVKERQSALERKLAPDELPEVIPVVKGRGGVGI